MSNKDLQSKYDEMHKQGPSAWFSDGREERELILKMGEPWKGKRVMEIGCGEGTLALEIARKADFVAGYDYSYVAIKKAQGLSYMIDNVTFHVADYRDGLPECNILVMQGVLEHLDDPFGELQWMIEHFKPKTVITSSPCFCNPRGIVWMTLDMLGAVMSKTDLHYLNPWEFEAFCENSNFSVAMKDCDFDWGNDDSMVEDLRHRIPLALKDGKLTIPPIEKFSAFLHFLDSWVAGECGATMVYRIDIP